MCHLGYVYCIRFNVKGNGDQILTQKFPLVWLPRKILTEKIVEIRLKPRTTLRTSMAGCEINKRLVNKFGSVKENLQQLVYLCYEFYSFWSPTSLFFRSYRLWEDYCTGLAPLSPPDIFDLCIVSITRSICIGYIWIKMLRQSSWSEAKETTILGNYDIRQVQGKFGLSFRWA